MADFVPCSGVLPPMKLRVLAEAAVVETHSAAIINGRNSSNENCLHLYTLETRYTASCSYSNLFPASQLCIDRGHQVLFRVAVFTQGIQLIS